MTSRSRKPQKPRGQPARNRTWPAGACHATAVLAGSVGILLRGPSGSGKSTLAAMLTETGATLIADDYVYLTARSGRLVARTPAAIAGLIELHGLGIVARPFESAAIIRLLVDLVEPGQMQRMPAPDAAWATLAGVKLARQAVPAPGLTGTAEPALVLIRQAIAAADDHKSLHLAQVSP